MEENKSWKKDDIGNTRLIAFKDGTNPHFAPPNVVDVQVLLPVLVHPRVVATVVRYLLCLCYFQVCAYLLKNSFSRCSAPT
jgi:hypothetical protein